ncbi:MAG: glutamate 5-kinase [Fuerstiella sp.]|nr:glutamate 5-kinase [Fuerstiella sp.]MCP4509126.1 glutamate 5-kinase [Fuerstiella sp.]
MRNLVRQEVFDSSRTLIVKIGSNVLTRDDDQLDEDGIGHLSEQIDRLIFSGRKVVIVSSGAVAAGIGVLGLTQSPESLPALQAAAAAGQTRLMKEWGENLNRSGHVVAQILVTVNDFRNRRRYLNVRNTIRTLLDFGVVPVVNENDSVSTEEIALGDNDQLASMIAAQVPDPLLIILSGIDGLYDGPPSDPTSNLISLVEKPDVSMLSHVAAEQSSRGRGGMSAKLSAIIDATSVGESVILANGREAGVLDRISRGDDVGTLFLAAGTTVPAWKKWIGYATRPEGKLVLDEGARRAVVAEGRSLLAVGISDVIGDFDQGASVELVSSSHSAVARGLSNYSSVDVRRILGRRTAQIRELIGHVPYGEVVHRDNLVVTDVGRTAEADNTRG